MGLLKGEFVQGSHSLDEMTLEHLRRRVSHAKEHAPTSELAGGVYGGVEWNPLSFGRWAPTKLARYAEFCRENEFDVTQETYDFFARTYGKDWHFDSYAFVNKGSLRPSRTEAAYALAVLGDSDRKHLTWEVLENWLTKLCDGELDVSDVIAALSEKFVSVDALVGAVRDVMYSPEKFGVEDELRDVKGTDSERNLEYRVRKVLRKHGYLPVIKALTALDYSLWDGPCLKYYFGQLGLSYDASTQDVADRYKMIDEKLFEAEIAIFGATKSPFEAFIRMGMLYLARSVECIDKGRDFFEVSRKVVEFEGNLFEFVDQYCKNNKCATAVNAF